MTGETVDWRTTERFDRSLYDRLDLETGGAGGEIVATYLAVVPVRKAAMLEAAAAGRSKELGRLAHMAKSGSRSLGLLRLANLCEMIEHQPPADPQGLADLGPVIESEFDAAVAVLTELQQE